MFFTREDIQKIKKGIFEQGVKDTDFKDADDLIGEEYIVVVQDNQNKKVFLKDLVAQIFNLGVSDFINVSEKYDAYIIDLEEAIRLIPSRARKKGQVITFLNKENFWQIYQFKGALNQWNVLDQWEDLFANVIIDSILPDEEDLTKSVPDENGNSYLSLKDRKYKPEDFSGLGKIILRKNIVEVEDSIKGKIKKNILYQDMITQSNTIYEIRYDFDLNGAEITIPEGCVLDFQGGSLSNGMIVGDNTYIKAGLVKIFNLDVVLNGEWTVAESYPEWFGAVGNGIIDDAVSINKVVQSVFDRVVFSDKTYAINDTITLTHSITLIGKEGYTKIYNLKKNSIAAISANSINNIILDGFEIDFNADSETGYYNTLCFRNGVVDFKNCNHSIIRNCKIHGVRNQMSNIIFQGDYNEVDHCEVYTGSGNRMTSGIVMGWFNMSNPQQNEGAGCNYVKVHDCYVHDISVGTEASESGYGIYLLGSSYSEVYNNVVENVNWAGINSQSEGTIPGGRNNKIFGNTVTINSTLVHPRHDYFGPFHIYTERTKSCEVYDNILNVGICNSGNGRYVPLQISDGGENSIVRDNKILKYGVSADVFVLDGTNGTPNVWATYGIDDTCILEGNYCDFAAKSAVFCYNSEHLALTIRNQNLYSDSDYVIHLFGDSFPETGSITIENCEILGKLFMSGNPSYNFDIKILNCKIDMQGHTGADGSIIYYNKKSILIKDCEINNLAEPFLYVRYGKGDIALVNNVFNTVSTYGKWILRGLASDYSYNIDIVENTFNLGVEGVTILLPTSSLGHLNICNNEFNYATPAETTVDNLIYVAGNSSHNLGVCVINGNKTKVSNVNTFIEFNSFTGVEKAIMMYNQMFGFLNGFSFSNDSDGKRIVLYNIGTSSNETRKGASYPTIKTNCEILRSFIKTDFGNRIGFWNGSSWQDVDGFPMHKNRGTRSEIPANPGDAAIGKHWFLTDEILEVIWSSVGWIGQDGIVGIAARHYNHDTIPNEANHRIGAKLFIDDLKMPAYFTGSYWVTPDGMTVAPHIGTTLDRPKNSNAGGVLKNSRDNGFCYFDTDLGKPIWAKSVHDATVDWVDATGAEV